MTRRSPAGMEVGGESIAVLAGKACDRRSSAAPKSHVGEDSRVLLEWSTTIIRPIFWTSFPFCYSFFFLVLFLRANDNNHRFLSDLGSTDLQLADHT